MIFLNIAITVILWAAAFVAIRVALEGFPPFELALFRYLIAAVTLAVAAPFIRLRFPAPGDLARMLLAGLLGISIYSAALNWAELTVTAGEACFIINTSPLFTALFSSLFLKEHLTQRFITGLVVSFAGVCVIALEFDGGLSLKAGTLALVLAAMAQAGFFVLQRPLLKRYRPLDVVCWAVWGGTLFLVPLGTGFAARLPEVDFHITAAVIYLGIFPTALANLTWTYVLSKMPAARAASFLYTVPAVTLAVGVVWIGELPSWISISGGLITIAGVAFANSTPNRSGEKHDTADHQRRHPKQEKHSQI